MELATAILAAKGLGVLAGVLFGAAILVVKIASDPLARNGLLVVAARAVKREM